MFIINWKCGNEWAAFNRHMDVNPLSRSCNFKRYWHKHNSDRSCQRFVYYTLTTSTGCVSVLSANVIIPVQPIVPTPPLIGTITQPSSDLPTGSVVLNGLPSTGSWTLTLTPGNLTTLGAGITKTISGLAPGSYSFAVTNF